MKKRASIAVALLAGAAVIVAAGVAIGGCTFVPKVAASGRLAGYAIDGPVDSRWASDYLEGRPLPAPLETWRRRYIAADRVPSREVLAGIARDYSTDVATLLLLEVLSARAEVRTLRHRYEAELAHVRRVGLSAARPDTPADLLVLMVPGWFYETHGDETNADYAIQRRLLERWGIAHRLVPIDENGSVEVNARTVAAAIREASQRHRILLVSASKSAGEVALALGRELAPQETGAVIGWLSLVGVVQGSPLADRVLEPDLCWFTELSLGLEGFDLDGAMSMRTTQRRPEFEGLAFPAHVRTLVFMAVPLSGHITDRGAFGYARMRVHGPNDGLTLLADELIPGAVPLLVPGMDHFLGPGEQETWSTAIFRVLAADMPP